MGNLPHHLNTLQSSDSHTGWEAISVMVCFLHITHHHSPFTSIVRNCAIFYQERACYFLSHPLNIAVKKKKKTSDDQRSCRLCISFKKRAPFLPWCCLGSFTWTLSDSLSPPRCTRLHFECPLNKYAMSPKWIERKISTWSCQLYYSPPLAYLTHTAFLWNDSKKFTFLT